MKPKGPPPEESGVFPPPAEVPEQTAGVTVRWAGKGDGVKRFTLRLDDETHATLEVLAFLRDCSMQQLVEGYVLEGAGAELEQDDALAASVRRLRETREMRGR